MRARSPGVTIARHAIAFSWLVLVPGATFPRALAAGPEITSVYTDFDSDKCPHEEGTEEEDYGSWTCPGYDGIDILLSAGDQRMTVTFGTGDSDDDIAQSQSFPSFNDVYKGRVEWRIEKTTDGRSVPFATILRWNVMTAADSEKADGPTPATGQVLVVTRLGPGGICHVGYVDARAHPDANALARRIADEHARSFQCEKDEPIVP